MPAFESLSAAVVATRTTGRSDSTISNGSKSADLYVTELTESVDRMPSPLNAAIRGKFSILVVDDDTMGRKLLQKRFARLFPDAEISEVASGEEALRATETCKYDIITIDHFMAVDELSGEETIRELRGRDVDALIIGISGNLKEKEHLAAGAQDFFQKPIPNDQVLLSRLLDKVAPPSTWKVLCVDDVPVNIHFLCRRLRKVAAPHFTSLEEAEKVCRIMYCFLHQHCTD